METEPKSLQELPEAPEWLKTLHWLVHHFTREGKMVRQAPVAFIVTCGIVIYAWYWVETVRHKDETDRLGGIIATKEATIQSQDVEAKNQATTITNQQNTILQLQEQLKGISPQLAAIQATRDNTRKTLQSFYVAAGVLFNRPATNEASIVMVAETEAWATTTANWIEANMGIAAKEKFLDPGIYPSMRWGGDERVDNVKNFLQHARVNLSTLIETAAWDGSPSKQN